jgi:hypothetical protein
MPTNRKFRTRNRRDTCTSEIERFFVDGHVEPHSDTLFDIFASPEKIYTAWESVKHILRKQHKRLLAWSVFEAGKPESFPRFPWITQQAFAEWKKEHE